MRDDDFIEGFVRKLDKVRRSGVGWSALCPSHEDSSPSLTVGMGKEGRILVRCHRGCTTEEITDALGMQPKDLFREKISNTDSPSTEAVYDYTDAHGKLIFQVVRRRTPEGKKDFRQRRPDGAGGWIWTITDLKEKPIYNLPKVLEALMAENPVWVVEGEKDADALEARGIVATCNSGGAGKWQRHHTDTLAKAKVIISPDMDGPGFRHAQFVRDELEGVAESVRVVAPPDGHNDVADALEAGASPLEFKNFDVDAALAEHDPFRATLRELRGLSQASHLTLDQKVARARAQLDHLQREESGDQFGRLVKWDTFLAEPVEEYDWVIPGLLERSERVIVVAAEGVGKTMLGRQVALLSSAGLSPFKMEAMPPITTLFVDLENPERIIRRTSRQIADTLRVVQSRNRLEIPAHLLVKPDGVNLLEAKDRDELEQVVALVEPDLLFLGPLYKSFIDPGGQTSEAVTVTVARFLDYLRDSYGCALWLEHHAPLGGSDSSRPLRPFGSSVWSRWSEFGIALRPDPVAPGVFDLAHYRGQRDQREWPRRLRRGGEFPFTSEF